MAKGFSRNRRNFFVIAPFLPSFFGCDGSTDPGDGSVLSVNGRWILASISSQGLPFLVNGGGFGDPTLIVDASLIFKPGAGLDSVVYRTGNNDQSDTLSFTYSQRSDTVFINRPPQVDTAVIAEGSPAQLRVRRQFRTGAGGFPSGRVDALYLKPER
ncbi:MAG: hypothetical protein H7Z74_13570 [Anaerolineae bacterium]|nr:hypothetical protein [Gemmatimonadaceae bacterium]